MTGGNSSSHWFQGIELRDLIHSLKMFRNSLCLLRLYLFPKDASHVVFIDRITDPSHKTWLYLHHYWILILVINVFFFLESAEDLLHWFLRSQGCTVHFMTGIPIYTSILLHKYIYTFKKWKIISSEKIFLGKPWYWCATLSPLSKSESPCCCINMSRALTEASVRWFLWGLSHKFYQGI